MRLAAAGGGYRESLEHDRHRADAARLPVPRVDVRVKRVYARPEASDGMRILVDASWPRGIGRSRAALDDWMADLAPSPALGAWFGHDPARWEEFRRRYRLELRSRRPTVEALRRLSTAKRVTLLYAASDPLFNNAQVLKQLIEAS